MDDHDNLCPECNGNGVIAGPLMLSPSYYDPPEYEDELCPACAGTGTLTAIPTEEEVSLARLIHHIMPGPYGPTKVYREDIAEYERWLDSL